MAADLDGISGSSTAWCGMKNSEGMNNDDLKRSRESRRLKINPQQKRDLASSGWIVFGICSVYLL